MTPSRRRSRAAAAWVTPASTGLPTVQHLRNAVAAHSGHRGAAGRARPSTTDGWTISTPVARWERS